MQKLRENIEGRIDAVTYTVAVPFVPPDHWTLDETEGGGRLITEGEHFIDLCHLLIGRPPLSVYARALGKMPDDVRKLCNWAVTIHYEDAVADIIFNESGATAYPREKITVFARGQVAILDDFAKLRIYARKIQTFGNGRQADMGHKRQLKEFVAAIRGEPSRLSTWEDASMATLCLFAAQESIRSGEAINLREFKQALTATT